jgi:hypothetical protein
LFAGPAVDENLIAGRRFDKDGITLANIEESDFQDITWSIFGDREKN